MIKNLCICVALYALTGCILVVDDNPSHRGDPYTYSSYDFWFEDVYVSCEYDYWSDTSFWSFTAYTAGTQWIYDMSVLFGEPYDAPSLSFSAGIAVMSWQHGDLWVGTKESTTYYCGYPVDLEFVASDGYGNMAYASVWW